MENTYFIFIKWTKTLSFLFTVVASTVYTLLLQLLYFVLITNSTREGLLLCIVILC